MPKVNISQECSLSPSESYSKICSLLSDDKDLRKLDPSYACDFNDSDLTGSAKGSQFKAKMNVEETSQGSKVNIEVELPFHLGLVKGMVKSTLEKKLASILN